jgi:MurNAc alpha-1-phosphate uridylyltransferase
VANIDSVWIESDPDGTALKALCDQWNTDEMDAALLVTAMETSHGFDGPGDFFLNDGRLAFRNDAASAPWNYMGVHITKPQIVYAEPDGAFSLSRIWRRLAPEGRLHGTVFTGEWMHVGDPAARDFAEARLKA